MEYQFLLQQIENNHKQQKLNDKAAAKERQQKYEKKQIVEKYHCPQNKYEKVNNNATKFITNVNEVFKVPYTINLSDQQTALEEWAENTKTNLIDRLKLLEEFSDLNKANTIFSELEIDMRKLQQEFNNKVYKKQLEQNSILSNVLVNQSKFSNSASNLDEDEKEEKTEKTNDEYSPKSYMKNSKHNKNAPNDNEKWLVLQLEVERQKNLEKDKKIQQLEQKFEKLQEENVQLAIGKAVAENSLKNLEEKLKGLANQQEEIIETIVDDENKPAPTNNNNEDNFNTAINIFWNTSKKLHLQPSITSIASVDSEPSNNDLDNTTVLSQISSLSQLDINSIETNGSAAINFDATVD